MSENSPLEHEQFLRELLSAVERVAISDDLTAMEPLMAMTAEHRSSPLLASLAEAFARMAVNLEAKDFRLQCTIEDLLKVKNDLEQANYDPLTGLANRVIARDRLHQALVQARRTGQAVAVFYMDLDKFKWVNDNLGHAAGDELLQQVAKRFRDCARSSDTVARLGGDEFLMVLPNTPDKTMVIDIATRCVSAIQQPFALAAGRAQIGTSIGIALLGEHGDTVDSLIEGADGALYAAKHAGRNGYAWASTTGSGRIAS